VKGKNPSQKKPGGVAQGEGPEFKSQYHKKKKKKKKTKKPHMVVVHASNPSTQEIEAGGSQVLGQPGLHRQTLCQKKKIIF
jgi:hypothetical protein